MAQVSPELLSQFAAALAQNQAQRQAEVSTETTPPAAPASDDSQASIDATSASETQETEATPEFLKVDSSEHPDVIAKAKNLERGFHEARRKDTEQVRAMQERVKELELKANAFDILSDADDPAAVIKGIRGEKQAEAENPPPSGYSFAIPKEALDTFDEATVKGILAIVQAGNAHSQNALLQQLAPYKTLIESIGLEKYQSQWTELDKEFPGASAHKSEVEKFARDHNVPVRQALMAVKGEELMTKRMKAGVQASRRSELVNPAAVAAPSGVKPAVNQKYDKRSLALAITKRAKELGLPDKFQH